jgi:hypothetical protein
MECRQHFDEEHGAPVAPRAPPIAPAAGTRLRPFAPRLRAVRWPGGFKIIGVNTYNSKANPALWLTLYEITMRATGRSEDVIANYLPIMLN